MDKSVKQISIGYNNHLQLAYCQYAHMKFFVHDNSYKWPGDANLEYPQNPEFFAQKTGFTHKNPEFVPKIPVTPSLRHVRILTYDEMYDVREYAKSKKPTI